MSVPDPTRHFVGGLLMAVGGLMMALCGACSAFALIIVVPSVFSLVRVLMSGDEGGDDYALVFVQSFVLFGVVPILIGLGLFLFGRRLRINAETHRPKPIGPPPPGADAP